MPFNNIIDKQNHDKEYHKNHKEERNKYSSNYYQTHKNLWVDKREENKEAYNQNQRKFRKKLKYDVLSHYSNGIPKCVCCGEEILAFLSIDHINNDGYKDRKINKRSGIPFYYWLKNNNFPEGYQTLCMNCQFGKKNNRGICPHKIEGYKNE